MSSRKSTSKRKTTSSSTPKRKTTSSTKKKLEWVPVPYGYPDPEFKPGMPFISHGEIFRIKRVNYEKSKIDIDKKYKGDLESFLEYLMFIKILYSDHNKKDDILETTLIAQTDRETYIYWWNSFELDYPWNTEIITHIYECKSWSTLYKKLPVAVKKEIEKGNHGKSLTKKNGSIEIGVAWTESDANSLKNMVKEWFASQEIKDCVTQKKIKASDNTTKRKKQLSALNGVEKVCHIISVSEPTIKKLVIVGKRKDGKYVYLQNHFSKKSKKLSCKMDVTMFDNSKDLWAAIPSTLRKEIK